MNATTLLIACLAACATASGPHLATFAAKRVARQPLDIDTAAEQRLLDALERDTGAYIRCADTLNADDFTGTRRDRFHTIVEHYYRHGIKPAPENSSEQDATERVNQARLTLPGEQLDEKTYLTDGGIVLGHGASRALTTERNIVESTGDDNNPLARRAWTPTRGRKLATAAAAGIGVAVAATCATALIADNADTSVTLLAAICATILVTGGVILALVDIDAYVIDMPTFAWWLTGSVTAAAAAAITAGEPQQLWAGAGALAVVALYETLAYTMSKLRGVTQGFGDTLLVLGTAGVPAILTGRWETAIESAVAAGIVSLCWYTYLYSRGKATRTTPIPYAPFLITGAVIALAAGTLR
jgi:leader peptidase (prepilin peptidase)/N-methyltransferase